MRRRSAWALVGAATTVSVTAVFWIARLVPSAAAEPCGCTRGFLLAHPGVTLPGALVLALPTIGVLSACVRTAVLLLRASRLARTARGLAFASLDPGTRLFRSDRPDVFTVGLRAPATFISTAAWAGLDREARDAVLAHEAEHRRRRDPALRLLIAFAGSVIGWLPGSRRILASEELFLEARADAAAVLGHGRAALARAMEALLAPFDGMSPVPPLGAVGFVSAEDRTALFGNMGRLVTSRAAGARALAASLVLLGAVASAGLAWADDTPGSQCVAIVPACVAELPTATPAPEPISIPVEREP